MRTTKLTILAIALLGLFPVCGTGCGLLGDAPPPETPDVPAGDVDWPDLVKCAPTDAVIDASTAVADELLDQLQAAKGDPNQLGAEGKAALEKLGREHGLETIACAVEWLVREWTRPGASAEPTRRAGARRGSDFLGDVGTVATFEGDTGQ